MPPDSPTLRMCGTHSARRAGWACDACSAALCAGCVEAVVHVSTRVERCRWCGGNARRLTVHRSAVPYGRRVLEAWRYPLAPAGLAATAIFAAFHLAGDLLPPLAAINLALGGYAFFLVRETAAGRDEIAPPDFTSLSGDVFLPTLRALVASAWVALPALVWIGLREPRPGMDPLVPALIVLGLLYLPMAFLIAAAGTGILDLLNPVAGVAYAVRLGRDYWVCVAALAVVALGAAGVSALAARVPLLGLGIHAFAFVYFPFVAARVLGLLLFTRGDAVGYGVAADYQVPIEAGIPAAAEESPLPEPAPALQALAAALETRDVEAVLTSFQELPDGPAAIPPEWLIHVAQAASSLGRWEVARSALEGATRAPSPHEPKAWVLLARLLGEKLNEPKRANEIYGYVCRKFPGTHAAQFAEERLGRI